MNTGEQTSAAPAIYSTPWPIINFTNSPVELCECNVYGFDLSGALEATVVTVVIKSAYTHPLIQGATQAKESATNSISYNQWTIFSNE